MSLWIVAILAVLAVAATTYVFALGRGAVGPALSLEFPPPDFRHTFPPEVHREIAERTRVPRHHTPVFEATRGESGSHRKIGVLSSTRDESDHRILPLYGRPTYPRANKWNYMTTTDGYVPLELPVRHKGADCSKPDGCDELDTGDHVRVDEYGDTFRIHMYEHDAPRYLSAV